MVVILRFWYVTIIFVGLFVTLPLIMYGLPPASHDAVFHAFYFENFSNQLSLGEFYPRWLYLINGGLGGPTFFYYQPTAYYITYLLSLPSVGVMHQLGAASSLGVIFSGITAFLWLREISSPLAALTGAIFYLLMPYPVGHDVYVRAAYGEAFAFVWMPLILFFVVKIARGSRLGVIGLAVSYALLCTTHLPITLIFSGIPILYSLIVPNNKNRLRSFAATLAGMVLGSGIAAAYIIPAIAYQDFVFLDELRQGQFSFVSGLMTTELSILGSMRYFWMAFEVAVMSFVCFIIGISVLSSDSRLELSFWMVVLISSIFMMLYISHPIWEAFEYLQALQFPFRFNALASLAALPMIAHAVSSIKKAPASLVFGIIFFSLCGIYWAFEFSKVKTEAFNPRPAWKIDFDTNLNRLGLETHARWPRTVPSGVYDLEKSLSKIPGDGAGRAKAYLTNGVGDIRVFRWQPRDLGIQIDVPAAATVNVTQFFYPGWRARIAGSVDDLPIRASDDLGLISVAVPPGNHQINFTLVELWPEYVAEWFSIGFSLLTFILFLWILLLRRKPL